MAYLDPSRGGSARAVPPSVYGPPAEGGYWPPSALQAFTLRMASHGLCVSSSMMLGDRCYALEQLSHAHSLADDDLRDLAMELFRFFERRQSGLPHLL